MVPGGFDNPDPAGVYHSAFAVASWAAAGAGVDGDPNSLSDELATNARVVPAGIQVRSGWWCSERSRTNPLGARLHVGVLRMQGRMAGDSARCPTVDVFRQIVGIVFVPVPPIPRVMMSSDALRARAARMRGC